MPDELDPTVTRCADWTSQGRLWIDNSPALAADINEFYKFGLKSTVSFVALLVLNRARGAVGLAAYAGFSEAKWRTRLLPALQQLVGFLGEVLDVDASGLDDLLEDGGGRRLFAYAASVRVMRMGGSVVEERLDAVAEVVQYLAVRRGVVNKGLLELSLSLKELGKRVGQLIPRAPRFADEELLRDPIGLLTDMRELVTQFLEVHSEDNVRESWALAVGVRQCLLIYLMTPLGGSHRAQTLARLQVDAEGPCVTCGDLRCRGNRIVFIPGDQGGAGAEAEVEDPEREPWRRRIPPASVRLVIAHHKNSLAGRTRAIIEFASKDVILAELLRMYTTIARPILHAPVLEEEEEEEEASESEGEGEGEEVEGAGGGGAGPAGRPRRGGGEHAPGQPRDYLFLSLAHNPVLGRKRRARDDQILAGDSSRMSIEVSYAAEAVLNKKGFGYVWKGKKCKGILK